MKKSYYLLFIVLLVALALPTAKIRATMTSETYSIEAGRVGTGELSLPFAQSENYTTQATDIDDTETDVVGDDGGGKKKKKKKTAATATVTPGTGTIVTDEEATEEQEQSVLPGQLFDINLEVDDPTIFDISELSARVMFASFGTEPTPVDLTFEILDSSRNIVHTSKDYVEVQTELIFNKKFSGFTLPKGKYTLRLVTLYNVDVRDEFTADFEIIKETGRSWCWLIIPFLILAIILAIVVYRRYRSRAAVIGAIFVISVAVILSIIFYWLELCVWLIVPIFAYLVALLGYIVAPYREEPPERNAKRV